MRGLRKPHLISHYLYSKIPPPLMQLYRRITYGKKTFQFQGQVYNYFCHRYNTTWVNERAVEIPIIWQIVKNFQGRVLELGNVLSHYYPVSHDIIDKYEKAKSVTNIDIVDFQPQRRYDLVVSISTIEHIGWDEKPCDPEKILNALKNLQLNCISTNGKIILTFPLGHNLELDKLLNQGKIQLGNKYFMKRVSEGNEWIEVEWNDVQGITYNAPFPFGNAIVIGIFQKK